MSIEIQKNVPLARYTTFRIGGPAKFFVVVKNEKELIEALDYAKENKLEYFILGGGSNVLVSDKGFDGLVIKIGNNDIKIEGEKMYCGAGATLARAFRLAVDNDLSGMEWMIGIPGATIGGSIRGNAEAFSVSMKDLVESVEVFDIDKNKFRLLKNNQCGFTYRSSIFKEKNNYLIWESVLKLKKEKKEIISSLIKKTLEHRNSNYPKFPSAGSIFKNSITFDEIKKHNKKLAEYATINGIVSRMGNVGSGFLIDYLDLKGKKIGGAMISEKHGNFIINTGGATAEDVVILISFIKQQVRGKLGIQLVEEVQYVGF